MGDQVSDYVIYVDESGDHSLSKINSEFPVFVLAFCILKINDYVNVLDPGFRSLKFEFFGHDLVIFHEREIRKRTGDFAILSHPVIGEKFHAKLTAQIERLDFKVVACVIDKHAYRQTGYETDNPYRVAMQFGLERAFYELQSLGQIDRKTPVIFESRGKREDDNLELEFLRILSRTRLNGMQRCFRFESASKKINNSGLQLADLVARPIAQLVLKPNQQNRAVEVIKTKFRKSPSGEIQGWGLKLVP